MKNFFIILLLSFFGYCNAQSNQIIKVNPKKQVYIFFKSPIVKGASIPNKSLFTFDSENGASIGIVTGEKNKDSNLLITTKDGLTYSFSLMYSKKISKLNYFINKKDATNYTSDFAESENAADKEMRFDKNGMIVMSNTKQNKKKETAKDVAISVDEDKKALEDARLEKKALEEKIKTEKAEEKERLSLQRKIDRENAKEKRNAELTKKREEKALRTAIREKERAIRDAERKESKAIAAKKKAEEKRAEKALKDAKQKKERAIKDTKRKESKASAAEKKAEEKRVEKELKDAKRKKECAIKDAKRKESKTIAAEKKAEEKRAKKALKNTKRNEERAAKEAKRKKDKTAKNKKNILAKENNNVVEEEKVVEENSTTVKEIEVIETKQNITEEDVKKQVYSFKDITLGYADKGFGLHASYNKFMKKAYYKIGLDASFSKIKNGDFDIPVNVYDFNIGYYFPLLHKTNFNWAIGAGGLLGFETVNNGDNILDKNNSIEAKNNFIYGAYLGTEIGIKVSNRMGIVGKVNQNFYLNSDVGTQSPYFGIGLRFLN